MMSTGYLLGYLTGLLIRLLFYFSIFRCLKQVQPDNRRIHPHLVWLNIIPVFNLVWHIHTVFSVKTSLESEYRGRDIPIADDFGLLPGFMFSVMAIVLFAGDYLISEGMSPTIRKVVLIFLVVNGLIYWYKLLKYTSVLRRHHSGA